MILSSNPHPIFFQTAMIFSVHLKSQQVEIYSMTFEKGEFSNKKEAFSGAFIQSKVIWWWTTVHVSITSNVISPIGSAILK